MTEPNEIKAAEGEHNAKGVGSTDWLDGVPEVLPGHRRNYLVTIRGQSGRRYVRTAYYANNQWLDWHEDYVPDDDESEGKYWTGWQEDRCDRHGDEITLALEGTVIGYMPLPTPSNVGDQRPMAAK